MLLAVTLAAMVAAVFALGRIYPATRQRVLYICTHVDCDERQVFCANTADEARALAHTAGWSGTRWWNLRCAAHRREG